MIFGGSKWEGVARLPVFGSVFIVDLGDSFTNNPHPNAKVENFHKILQPVLGDCGNSRLLMCLFHELLRLGVLLPDMLSLFSESDDVQGLEELCPDEALYNMLDAYDSIRHRVMTTFDIYLYHFDIYSQEGVCTEPAKYQVSFSKEGGTVVNILVASVVTPDWESKVVILRQL